MAISFQCGQCTKKYRVDDALAGKTAKCPCGERLQIPIAPARPIASKMARGRLRNPALRPEDELTMLPPATGFNDLLEGELTSSGGANEASAAQADLQREIEKLNPFPLPHRGLLNGVLRAGSSRLLQLLAATAVGSMFGFSGASEMKDSTTTTAIYGALGGATVGAMIGMLLLASDWVKARRAAGRHAPWLLELYVGRGFLSIVMWFVTAFLGAFAFIAWLAANTPGANPW